ncbi:MAG: GPR endopeptidase [Clostridia bacterium]|nr:GPR endopeptidase [Clostridia bacterium]
MLNDILSADLYTDLMSERRRADVSHGVEFKRYPSAAGIWERVRVTSEEGAKSIGRPIGRYHTLHTDPMSFVDKYSKDEIEEELANELWDLCDANSIIPKRVLVVGLGNRRLTPDSLGTAAAEQVFPTLHIKSESEDIFEWLSCSEIAVSTPDVKSESGLDTLDIIKASAIKSSRH